MKERGRINQVIDSSPPSFSLPTEQLDREGILLSTCPFLLMLAFICLCSNLSYPLQGSPMTLRTIFVCDVAFVGEISAEHRHSTF